MRFQMCKFEVLVGADIQTSNFVWVENECCCQCTVDICYLKVFNYKKNYYGWQASLCDSGACGHDMIESVRLFECELCWTSVISNVSISNSTWGWYYSCKHQPGMNGKRILSMVSEHCFKQWCGAIIDNKPLPEPMLTNICWNCVMFLRHKLTVFEKLSSM